jgi:hypothetical protein
MIIQQGKEITLYIGPTQQGGTKLLSHFLPCMNGHMGPRILKILDLIIWARLNIVKIPTILIE